MLGSGKSNGPIEEEQDALFTAYDGKTLKLVEVVQIRDAWSFDVSPDGTQIAFGGTKGLQVWDRKTRKVSWADEIPNPPPGIPFLTAAWSPDGKKIAALRGWFASLRPDLDGTWTPGFSNLIYFYDVAKKARLRADAFPGAARPWILEWFPG